MNKIRLPHNWRYVGPTLGGMSYCHRDGLAVVRSIDTEEDGKTWLHVSVSRKKSLPTYEDLKRVKSVFIGDDREAYQIFARKSKHVNVMEYCLHLWCPLEGFGLPTYVGGKV